LMLRHNTKFEAALHRGHTFAHANPKLSATSTGADLELMRQKRIALFCVVNMLRCNILGPHIPIGVGRGLAQRFHVFRARLLEPACGPFSAELRVIGEEEGRKDGVACNQRTLLCASVV